MVDQAHKEIKAALEDIQKKQKKMNDRLDDIDKKLEPIVKDRDGRAWLDAKVSKWLPRTPYIALLISAVFWYFMNKPNSGS